MPNKNNLKTILEKEGIQQIDLANEINRAQGTINKICNGLYNPSPTMKHRILKGLNKLSGSNYKLEDVFPE